MKANRRVGLFKLLDASQVDSLSANCREGSGGGRGGGARGTVYKILAYCTKAHFIHTNLQR